MAIITYAAGIVLAQERAGVYVESGVDSPFNAAAILRYVNESTWRVWRLYMAACALEFESGEIGVYQILACKRTGRAPALPLTRRHQYPITGLPW